MAIALEIRERQKDKLSSLLKVKKANKEKANVVYGLDNEILDSVVVMEQEDVAYVEKLVGVKAMD